jgi:para-nitrobenzyl esterase
MNGIFILIISALFMFSCTESQTFKLPDEVEIESGRITGVPGRNQSIMVFKGIPYAAPAVGDLRWRPPQPVQPWKGIKACDRFGPSAMQAPQAPFMMWSTEFIIDTSLGYSEDCLTLNVWTDAESSAWKRPVLLFIHGGGYTSGGSSCEIYDGEGLAKKGVVVVTINYRLGVFGFFTHPALSAESENRVSGNYGILDMIAALKWVKENIAAFGGDPGNVTIQGQSAGASAVNVLLLSPLATGLFQRAIPQSFNLLNRKMPTLSEMEASGMESAITDNNGTPMDQSDDRVISTFGSKSLAEMRAMRAEDMLAISFPSSPNVDGYVLPADTLEVLKAGHQNDVPVLSGMVEGDAMLFSGRFGGQPVNLEAYLESAREKYGEYADRFLALYPADNDAEAVAQKRKSALDHLNVLSYYSGKTRSIKGKTDTFFYYFTHVMPGPQSATHGAFHTADVPYSFNYFSPLRGDYWSERDYDIGNMMSDYWVNFMKTGDPNGQGLPEWPAWKDGDLEFMELGDTFSPVSIPKEKADFWQAHYNREFDLR